MTVNEVMVLIREQLAWRGPVTGKGMGHVVIPRAAAEALLDGMRAREIVLQGAIEALQRESHTAPVVEALMSIQIDGSI